jgi:hypothetical protein
MFSRTILAASLVLAMLTQAVDVTEQPDLIAKLITANSQLDRLALLPDDATHWHFDFTTKQNYNFAPGGVTNMNAATFPAAKGNRMTRECLPSPALPETKEGRTCSLQRPPQSYLYLPRAQH